ncbi:MAG: winged helix-turn-helix domain-containing protein, partial [Candidatus Rokuibacteriota bacterium]
QHAIHYLWMTGALTVHSRRHFQKRFDLMERVIAPGVEAVSSEQFLRWHLERSLHAMGAATELDLSRYLTYPRPAGAPRSARCSRRAS